MFHYIPLFRSRGTIQNEDLLAKFSTWKTENGRVFEPTARTGFRADGFLRPLVDSESPTCGVLQYFFSPPWISCLSSTENERESMELLLAE